MKGRDRVKPEAEVRRILNSSIADAKLGRIAGHYPELLSLFSQRLEYSHPEIAAETYGQLAVILLETLPPDKTVSPEGIKVLRAFSLRISRWAAKSQNDDHLRLALGFRMKVLRWCAALRVAAGPRESQESEFRGNATLVRPVTSYEESNGEQRELWERYLQQKKNEEAFAAQERLRGAQALRDAADELGERVDGWFFGSVGFYLKRLPPMERHAKLVRVGFSESEIATVEKLVATGRL